MKKIAALASAVVLSIGTGALAEGPAQTEVFRTDQKDPLASDVKMYRAEGVNVEGDDKHVVVCRNVYEVGTKIPRRLCRTRSEWNAIEAENETDLTHTKRSSGQKAAAAGIDRGM